MNQSLNNLGILVTRPQAQAQSLAELIQQYGGKAIIYPTIIITAQANHWLQCQQQLNQSQWIIFISVNAVKYGLAHLHLPQNANIVAIGQATANAITDRGYTVDIQPQQGASSDDLLAHPRLQGITHQMVTIIRGVGGRETLAQQLIQRGAKVEYIEVYQRQCPKDASPLILAWQQHLIQIITATSHQSLKNLVYLIQAMINPEFFATPLIVVSNRMQYLAQQMGFKQISVSPEVSNQAIVETILQLDNYNFQEQ